MQGRHREQVHGFLNISKPSGCTSMDVVRRVKRLTGQKRRVGHGGTLDPLAQGVLPICMGQATRLMEHLVDSPKGYSMKVHLGVTTSTYDSEGEVETRRELGDLCREDVLKALESFQGTIEQTPPMYSALKHQGKRLYALARAGVEVERKPRQVEIFHIELLEFDPPSLTLGVECGRGVYMRSLAHQLGEVLGCGAHLSGLVRSRSGAFRLEDAVPLELLEETVANQGPSSWMSYLKPVDYALLDLKSTALGAAAERLIRTGQAVSLSPALSYAGYLERYRAYTADGRFLAVVRFQKQQNLWQPHQVFQLDQPSPHSPLAASASYEPNEPD